MREEADLRRVAWVGAFCSGCRWGGAGFWGHDEDGLDEKVVMLKDLLRSTRGGDTSARLVSPREWHSRGL